MVGQELHHDIRASRGGEQDLLLLRRELDAHAERLVGAQQLLLLQELAHQHSEVPVLQAVADEQQRRHAKPRRTQCGSTGTCFGPRLARLTMKSM